MKQPRAVPYPIRISDSLRQWLQQRADKNRRSLHAEVVLQLELARDREQREAKS